MTATVTSLRLASMQVCVPSQFTDAEVEAFANGQHPTGIESKWQIRREGDPALKGDPERVQCAALDDHVHIMLDC